MKKKVMAILFALTVITALLASGCAGGVPQSDYDSIVSKLNQAESRIAELEEELETAREEKDQAEAQLGEIQEKLSALEEIVTSLQEKAALCFVKNSPTFAFDGIEETLKQVGTEKLEALYTVKFTYEFDSRNGGYGDRTGQNLITVITPHTAVIIMERDEVRSAVLDGKWNMLTQTEVSGLEGVTWLLKSYTGEMGTREVLENTEVTLIFEVQAGRLGGFTGCNHYGAPYKIDGQNLTLTDNIIQTLIGCTEEIMEQEKNFTHALMVAETYKVEGDTLTITGGGWMLVFEKQQ